MLNYFITQLYVCQIICYFLLSVIKLYLVLFMKLKKVYLEITNRCNLSCPFCIKNSRKITDISKENYIYIINKIKDHTKELYLHILGEPLLHKDINYFIDYATSMGLLVNITTNG